MELCGPDKRKINTQLFTYSQKVNNTFTQYACPKITTMVNPKPLILYIMSDLSRNLHKATMIRRDEVTFIPHIPIEEKTERML